MSEKRKAGSGNADAVQRKEPELSGESYVNTQDAVQPDVDNAAEAGKRQCPPQVPPPSTATVEKWAWGLAVVALLLVIGKWRYDEYMAAHDPNILQEDYMEYLRQRWSRQGEALLANVSQDPSFTRYGDRRIYFRAITRTVPVPDSTPPAYKTKIAMSEVDDDNRWREDDDNNNNDGDELQCVGDDGVVHMHSVGLRSDGMRFTSSYVKGVKAEERRLDRHVSCLRSVLPLMCRGDKWEVVCAPEEAFGNAGEREVPPGATVVWRVSVERVDGSG
ncbi:putative FKBP-type peptidyl-prolyl cis-trans isomerase, partial [Trypanosoma grayi]|uniref:putative FKBP-type peptidyl-prolyl cis-trans isomerase n=1 Tax=Trypanosoma grayi TaxID=71804 RepID=UPI0004F4672F